MQTFCKAHFFINTVKRSSDNKEKQPGIVHFHAIWLLLHGQQIILIIGIVDDGY